VTTVDLSLPTNAQLLAAASPNPETEAARITASGNPEQVADVGAHLQRAGAELDQVYEQSTRTQGVLADAFANNGAPVYDARAHARSLPPGFSDAGTRLHDAGRRISVLSLELGSAIDDVNEAQSGMWQLVDSRRRTFAAEVAAAVGPGGLIPDAQVAALQARRASVAAQMQELVSSCGRDVVARVRRYQTVVEGCQQLLGELGLTAGGRRGFPGAQYEGNTVPAPGLHPPEIYPVPPPRPGEPGYTPIPGGLDGPLITLPAPDLGTGVADGPGSGQRVPVPPVTINPDAAPGGAESGGPEPCGTASGGAGAPTPPAVKPEVEDPKLNNLLDNLYKGVDNPNRVGDGTTADAIRHEHQSGQDVGGRNHDIKGRETVQGLDNWLKSHPDAPAHERAVAETERANLIQALNS
jgi:hypothetical protein